MEFQDKMIRCVTCGTEFRWTAGEQAFFASKGFQNEPKRCKTCKSERALAPPVSVAGHRPRIETVTVCASCGAETTVPFKPTQGRPVLCRDCFDRRQKAP